MSDDSSSENSSQYNNKKQTLKCNAKNDFINFVSTIDTNENSDITNKNENEIKMYNDINNCSTNLCNKKSNILNNTINESCYIENASIMLTSNTKNNLIQANNNNNNNNNNNAISNHIKQTKNDILLTNENNQQIKSIKNKPVAKSRLNILSSDILNEFKSYFKYINKNEISSIINDCKINRRTIQELLNLLYKQNVINYNLFDNDIINIYNNESLELFDLELEEKKNFNNMILFSYIKSLEKRNDIKIRKIKAYVLNSKDNKYILYNYLPIMCTNIDCKLFNCKDDNLVKISCRYSHNQFEIDYHPLYYKIILCNDYYHIINSDSNFKENMLFNKFKSVDSNFYSPNVLLNNYSSNINSFNFKYINCPYSHSFEQDFRIIYNIKNTQLIKTLIRIKKLIKIENNFYLSELFSNYLHYYLIDNSKPDYNYYKISNCCNNMCFKAKEIINILKNPEYPDSKIDSLCFGIHDCKDKGNTRRPFGLFRYNKAKCESISQINCEYEEFCPNIHNTLEQKYYPNKNISSKLCKNQKINNMCLFNKICNKTHNKFFDNVIKSTKCQSCGYLINKNLIYKKTKRCNHVICNDCFKIYCKNKDNCKIKSLKCIICGLITQYYSLKINILS